jgi:hypothetical protein
VFVALGRSIVWYVEERPYRLAGRGGKISHYTKWLKNAGRKLWNCWAKRNRYWK